MTTENENVGTESGADVQQKSVKEGQNGAENKGTESRGESLLENIDGDGAKEGYGQAPIDFAKGKPEGFPDDAWDAEKKAPKADVLFTELQKAQKMAADLRAKMGKGDHKAPKDPSGYQFKASEKAAKYIKADDPIVAAAAKAAHKYGLSAEKYSGFMTDMADAIADLTEASLADATRELTPEEKKEIRDAEYAKIGGNAPQIVKAVESWGRELKAQGILSEDEVDAFKSMAVTGEQVRVLNKLRSIAGGGNIIPMDVGDDSLPSDREIADMLDKAAQKKDEAEYRRIEEKYYPLRKKAGRGDKLAI